MADVAKADPGARRRAICIIIVVALIGAVLIEGLERYLPQVGEWARADPSGARSRFLFSSFAFLSAAPCVAFAVYLWFLGARIIRARQFPPPGLRVLRDTAILTGEAALFRGRLLRAFAVGFVIAAVLLALMLLRLASTITGQAG